MPTTLKESLPAEIHIPRAELPPMSLPDYHSITETPGLPATEEQLARLYHRYRFSRDYTLHKKVLEVGCGSGLGLKYLSLESSLVAGLDIDLNNIRIAASHHNQAGLFLIRGDAQFLPFRNRSFDVVLLFEALYYLKGPEMFVREAARVISEDGRLIISTVNRSWDDFHPSPFAHNYFTVPELIDLLGKQFPQVLIFGAFPVQSTGMRNRAVSLVKRLAVNMHLIPGSLAARAYLKRLFIGPLKPLPASLEEVKGVYSPPQRIAMDRPNKDFKIIYAVACHRGGSNC